MQLLKNRKQMEALFVLGVYLLVLQDPLQRLWGPFYYIDEAVALAGLLFSVWTLLTAKEKVFSWHTILPLACLGLFVASGLAGNLLYRYQPWKSVIIDLYTNLKFFFAINLGWGFLKVMSWESLKKQANFHARILTVLIFALFLVDRVFPIWEGEVRYGIRSAYLFYSHPTYLAGAMVFLLSLMAACYEKKNVAFMLMDLVLIAFSLRSKAIASAMVFCAIWVFLVFWKQRVKVWHLAVLAVGGVVVALPQIRFYFIELADFSARSILLLTSLQIMKDYFPIGTGFGTYASAEAAKHYSPVYEKYGFMDRWELRNPADTANTQRLMEKYNIIREELRGGPYFNDTFWPIIFGQTGVLGAVSYCGVLMSLAVKCWKLRNGCVYHFAVVMYIWFHLLISSTAEPAFNNATGVPFALVLGIILCVAKAEEKK